jgi:hypothetical protein
VKTLAKCVRRQGTSRLRHGQLDVDEVEQAGEPPDVWDEIVVDELADIGRKPISAENNRRVLRGLGRVRGQCLLQRGRPGLDSRAWLSILAVRSSVSSTLLWTTSASSSRGRKPSSNLSGPRTIITACRFHRTESAVPA